VLVVDWSESFGNMGPRDQDIVSKSNAIELFETHGFVLEKEMDAGEHHYGLVFRQQ
jgi:hypothetical protein